MKTPPTFRERALCRGIAELLIPELRKTARAQGYALCVHGSLERDIDLVAVPWVDEAVRPEALAEAIRKTAQEFVGVAFINLIEEFPRGKPHGRLSWSFHLGGGPYIDLSVMPRLESPSFQVKRVQSTNDESFSDLTGSGACVR